MSTKDLEAKDRIAKAAMEILNEVSDPDTITVRQIAQRAKVGVGLINYHFQTKENLLYRAVGDAIAQMAVHLQNQNSGENPDPVRKLKTMLKEL